MKIKVLKIDAGKIPVVVEIDNGLESLQREVLGYIEAYYPFEDDVAVICNDEGKINGMLPNRGIFDEDGNLIDIIFGPFLVTGLTKDAFGTLDVELIEKYADMFAMPQEFYQVDGKIKCVSVNETMTM